MSEGKQSRLSAAQRADVWRRWKAGESLHEIGRACGKPHNCIRCVLLPSGGIAPAARRRSGRALSLAEREDISRGIASGSSIRAIASGLDRAASTVRRKCRSWLARILENLVRDRFRGQKEVPTTEVDDIEALPTLDQDPSDPEVPENERLRLLKLAFESPTARGSV
jgi:hypothetical protein